MTTNHGADEGARQGLDELERERVVELELLDRIAGLQAELDEVRTTQLLSPGAQLAAEQQLQALRRSPTWAAGRLLVIPYRAVRRLRRVLLG